MITPDRYGDNQEKGASGHEVEAEFGRFRGRVTKKVAVHELPQGKGIFERAYSFRRAATSTHS